jgi:hypothetical protein
MICKYIINNINFLHILNSLLFKEKSKSEWAEILAKKLTSTYFKCVKKTQNKKNILIFSDNKIGNISIRIFLKNKV